jgi:nicotinamidase-related amidase
MSKTALVLIDIQRDYFAGGKFALGGMEKAAEKASKLLKHFRLF